MMPLISLGPVRVSTAGLITLLAVVLWWWWSERRFIERGMVLPDWVFVFVIFATWLGSRLWVLIESATPHEVIFLQLLSVRTLDFSWSGAVVGGMVALSWSATRLHADVRTWLEILSLPTLVAFSLSAFGSFWSGADLGRLWDGPFAVQMVGAYRHPVQLYDMFMFIIGAFWCVWVERHHVVGGWWHLVIAMASNLLVVAGFRANVAVLNGGVVVIQIVALLLLIVAVERVMMLQRQQAR